MGMELNMKCPECGSIRIHKYGFIKKREKGSKKIIFEQRYRCYNCLRQFEPKRK